MQVGIPVCGAVLSVLRRYHRHGRGRRRLPRLPAVAADHSPRSTQHQKVLSRAGEVEDVRGVRPELRHHHGRADGHDIFGRGCGVRAGLI